MQWGEGRRGGAKRFILTVKNQIRFAMTFCPRVESTFSAIKRKFGDSVRSKTEVAMVNEVLCKILCHNICCLIQEQCELGIEPIFWKDGARVKSEIAG
jgi:hypothetical protein